MQKLPGVPLHAEALRGGCAQIRGADLTLSPTHHAAMGRLHPDRGVSLR